MVCRSYGHDQVCQLQRWLVVIDVLSKYLWMRPLKNKRRVSVANVLREILLEGRVPKRIRTDKGQEFRAKEVQQVLKDHKITHLYAQNETKAAIAERVKNYKNKDLSFYDLPTGV